MRRLLMRIMSWILFDDVCVVCGEHGSLLHPGCIHRLDPASQHRLPWVTSLWRYHDPRVRSLVKYLKKKEHLELFDICGQQLRTRIPTDAILVPIPASPSRKKEYAFNQSRALAKATGLPCVDMLEHTGLQRPKQALVRKRSTRLKNRHGCYRIKIDVSISPETHVVIIDDVSTTGATLIEAHRALQHAGYIRISAVTLAH
jgi:predicted amidophosphoribosyltransferase